MVFGNFETSADCVLPFADPLRSEGAFLTESGQLAQLKTPLPVADGENTFALIGDLADLEELKNLSSIRTALAGEVSEFSGLVQANGVRLIDTSLAPEIGDVAFDLREAAFAAYVAEKGL